MAKMGDGPVGNVIVIQVGKSPEYVVDSDFYNPFVGRKLGAQVGVNHGDHVVVLHTRLTK